jgi:hypothetical protein
MPKRREKVAHLGGHPAMFCGLLALDNFQSGPYASRKCVVILDYAVLIGKSW